MLNKKGLTLVETLVASAVITTIMLGTIPPSVRLLQQKVAEKTAKEIIAIQEAEKNYWIDKLNQENHGKWATSISQLQEEGYLPVSWSGQNLFGYPYEIETNSATCTIKTTLPRGLEGVIQVQCPNVSITPSGNNVIVRSTIPIPGQEPTMATLLHRYSTDKDLLTAKDPIYFEQPIYVLDDNASSPTEKVPGDIYVGKLKGKYSPSGWLSEAQFPAELRKGLLNIRIREEYDGTFRRYLTKVTLPKSVPSSISIICHYWNVSVALPLLSSRVFKLGDEDVCEYIFWRGTGNPYYDGMWWRSKEIFLTFTLDNGQTANVEVMYIWPANLDTWRTTLETDGKLFCLFGDANSGLFSQLMLRPKELVLSSCDCWETRYDIPLYGDRTFFPMQLNLLLAKK